MSRSTSPGAGPSPIRTRRARGALESLATSGESDVLSAARATDAKDLRRCVSGARKR
jgi:hypothetical protein